MLNAFDMKVVLPRTPESLLLLDDGFGSILLIDVVAFVAALGLCIESLRFDPL